MRVYVDLLRKADPSSTMTESKVGEMRGGKYAARAQVGQNKDGSPRYKYFATQEEYKKYLADQSDSKNSKDDQEKDDDTESTFPRITVRAKTPDSSSKKEKPKKAAQPLLVARKSLGLEIEYFYDVKDTK